MFPRMRGKRTKVSRRSVSRGKGQKVMYEDDWLESDYEDRNGGELDIFDDSDEWYNPLLTDNSDEPFEVVSILIYDPETDNLYES